MVDLKDNIRTSVVFMLKDIFSIQNVDYIDLLHFIVLIRIILSKLNANYENYYLTMLKFLNYYFKKIQLQNFKNKTFNIKMTPLMFKYEDYKYNFDCINSINVDIMKEYINYIVSFIDREEEIPINLMGILYMFKKYSHHENVKKMISDYEAVHGRYSFK